MSLDEISFGIAKFLVENSIGIVNTEVESQDCLSITFKVYRNGRTDEEINYKMRELKVLYVVLLDLQHKLVFRYKIIE